MRGCALLMEALCAVTWIFVTGGIAIVLCNGGRTTEGWFLGFAVWAVGLTVGLFATLELRK